ncbi:GNAT family N-acetyltransferase [Mucilaginibacter boryungensis]|uniref:GNAT family N-acetyltransferase n=1 Tax=Mucilaginibacter boryungensis TaxID=768480 RepID=A0ABR9XNG2_9SPHI|nr:GNAT family N-acetyltransferase [Mucilaginibacter boryungensis]MBE9668503.1 GNAT family N-acetyltransferase [Mucilaginibacter boryungensis]
MPIITETPRLIIRTFRPDEEEAYLALFSDERVNKHLPKRTVEENRKIFLDTLKEDIDGAIFSKWAVINKADGDFTGMGLLRTYENEPDKLEVGYCLHVKYWGQGIATELTKALIAYANSQGVRNIVAVTTPGNIASQVVLEKAGLVKQGNIVRSNEELVFFKM